MILSFYQVYRGNFKTSVIVAIPLLFIKFQNFILYLIPLLFYLLIKKYNPKKQLQIVLLLILAIILIFSTLPFDLLNKINSIRFTMFIDNGGIEVEYNHLNSNIDIIRYALTGFFHALLSPLPWNINGRLQFIQCIENIIIFVIIMIIAKNLIKINDKFKYLLFGYLAIHLSVYGLVVSNYGTLARYKFPFILIFIIFSIKIINDEKIKKISKIF